MLGKYRIAIGTGLVFLVMFAVIVFYSLLTASRFQISVLHFAPPPRNLPKDRAAHTAAKLSLEKIRHEISRNPDFLNKIGLENSLDTSKRGRSDSPYLVLQVDENSLLDAVSIKQRALPLRRNPGQHSVPGNSVMLGYRLSKATRLSISYNTKSGTLDAITINNYFSE